MFVGISEFVGRGLLTVAQVIAARSLGPEQFGLFTPVYVGASLMWVLLDLGHDRLLIKSTAAHREAANSLLLASLTARVGVGLVILAAVVGLSVLGLIPGYAILLGIWAVTEAIVRSVRGSLIGQLRAPVEMSLHLSQRVLTVASVLMFAHDASTAATAFAFGNSIAAVVAVTAFVRTCRPGEVLHGARTLVKGAPPLFVTSALNIVQGQSEILWLVVLLRDAVAVAFYRSATQILFAFLIPAQVLSTVGLTLMSREHSRGRAMRTLFAALLFTGLICGAVMGAFATPIISLVFGPEYEGAAILAWPFAITLVFGYISWGLVTLLLMQAREGAVLRATVFGAIASVAGNVLLVPRLGILGSGAARALTELTMASAFAYFSRSRADRVTRIGEQSERKG
jgi:O-antigen/teichoic acid export membrane protein